MNPKRIILGIAGILLFLLAAWQVQVPMQGLEVLRASTPSFPVTFIGPAGAMDGSRPLVLIAHGYSGSGAVMRGFALTLARAGYVTALWDFDGHGSNRSSLGEGLPYAVLVSTAETVLGEAARLGLVQDPSRVAILGHSMGSGVALSFGQQRPETGATIAVSPVETRVTPALPRNLLLLAGEREPYFALNAQTHLAEAGGSGGDPARGTGRKLALIPAADHMSILFTPEAHQTALDWLDAVFGPQPGRQPYTDLRIAWFGLGIAGVLLAAVALLPRPLEIVAASEPVRPVWRQALSALGGVLAATLLLWVLGRAGVSLATLLGLRQGGYVLVWFGLAGAITLLLLKAPPPRATAAALLAGLLVFAVLWVGVGALTHTVWAPWLLIPRRLVLWPLASLLLLPWFLSVAETQHRAGLWGRAAWWLLNTALVTAGLFLAIELTPGLSFLSLILPVLPALLLLYAVASLPQRARWTVALGGSLFVSWMLLAVFPLA